MTGNVRYSIDAFRRVHSKGRLNTLLQTAKNFFISVLTEIKNGIEYHHYETESDH